MRNAPSNIWDALGQISTTFANKRLTNIAEVQRRKELEEEQRYKASMDAIKNLFARKRVEIASEQAENQRKRDEELATYQQGQLGVAQQNAATQGRRADEYVRRSQNPVFAPRGQNTVDAFNELVRMEREDPNNPQIPLYKQFLLQQKEGGESPEEKQRRQVAMGLKINDFGQLKLPSQEAVDSMMSLVNTGKFPSQGVPTESTQRPISAAPPSLFEAAKAQWAPQPTDSGDMQTGGGLQNEAEVIREIANSFDIDNMTEEELDEILDEYAMDYPDFDIEAIRRGLNVVRNPR